MRVRTKFPRETTCLEHVWIEVSDGSRLAARIWLPVDAEQDPVPAVLEYIPYRKNDWTAVRDSVRQPYIAGHGYAAVRVDLRGSGDSDGIVTDQYTETEQSDALDVLRWLAEQAWCTGACGMIGYSWGGFNSLQVAALRPPQLKAIVAVHASDDNYADNEHYVGGAVLGQYMLPWAAHMLAFNARPPDPAVVGEAWRATWLERLENTPPFVEQWLAHQRRDAYWKHASVSEDYGAIECPVYLVAGWADAYVTPMLRLAEKLESPRKCLVGPWSHSYPDDGTPGPAIGFLHESVRWWDHWLKGIDSGLMDEPMCRLWLQDAIKPKTFYPHRPGRWVAERAWPSPDATEKPYFLGDGVLEEKPGAEGHASFGGLQTAGLECGDWLSWGGPADLAPDQRREDGIWHSFTSRPLEAPLEILGAPVLRTSIAADQTQALLGVRLCDVAPDGASTLISWGLLNLTHRDSDEGPSPITPGVEYDVEIPLKVAGYRLPDGHRLRVAVSPTFWPLAWPSASSATLIMATGARSTLVLPTRSDDSPDLPLPEFREPEGAIPLRTERIPSGKASRGARTIEHDLASGRSTLTVDTNHYGSTRFPDQGLEFGATMVDEYTIVEGDPLSASLTCEREITLKRDTGWDVRIHANSSMKADVDAFEVATSVEAFEGGERVFSKSQSARIPRDLC